MEPLIKRLHPDTKALVVINEYLRIRRDFPVLASYVVALAADRNETGVILEGTRNHLQQAGYQSHDVRYFIEGMRRALSAQLQKRAPAQAPQPAAPRPVDPRARTPLPPRRPAVSSGSAPRPAARPVPPRPSAFSQAQAKGRHGTLQFTRDPALTPVPWQQGKAEPRPPVVTPPPSSVPKGGVDAFGASRVGLNLEALQDVKPAETQQRPTVLVADDDPRARMMYHIKLEEAGYNIIDASNGQEAWQHIVRGGISGVVMDVKMPGMTGIQLLEQMHARKLVLPVVMVTSFDNANQEFAVQTYPKLRFLVKPVQPHKIAEALRNLGISPA